MNDLTDTVQADLIHSYKSSRQQVLALARPLSEEQFWLKPYPYGNSFGTLVQHLTGNLNYYIGAQIAGTGYIRDREREFDPRPVGKKEEILAKLDEAASMVIDTLKKQSVHDWDREYRGLASDAKNRFAIFLSCALHFRHHIGQMIYLVDELTNSD